MRRWYTEGMKILYLLFVWPEPTSSAAGLRTFQLIESCTSAGHTVVAASPCKQNPFQVALEDQGIPTRRFEPNDPEFDVFLREFKPDLVLFDRFMIEEQFSWRVREHCPEAIRVLDTIDLHSLRRTREKLVHAQGDPLLIKPEDLNNSDAHREIASIFRSDLSLVLSDIEIDLLQSFYNVPSELLTMSRFSYEPSLNRIPFSARSHFVAIGNCNHAPNRDSYLLLKEPLWGKIREEVMKLSGESPELHLYGAYPTERILQLNNPKEGFFVKGWAESAPQTLSQYRVNLAPLRFGAGIKGKISDGWSVGTPCVTTSIGAEGMTEGNPFGGVVSDSWDDFARAAARLYHDEKLWSEAQKRADLLLSMLFNPKTNREKFLKSLEALAGDLKAKRARNTTGSMLWHHQFRSTEYLSRWIEAKNKMTEKEAAHPIQT